MKITQIRSYEGRSIYSHRPVVAMLVDLGKYDGPKTSELPGFKGLLLEALPGLASHHCSSGRPGGFVRRLEDGTFLGHVIEHVALELQSLAGWAVIYGKTRQADKKGTYNVIFECGSTAGGREAGRRAVEIVQAVALGRAPEVGPHLAAIKHAAEESGLGPSTAALAAEAVRRGLPVRRLGATSQLVLGHGNRQRRVCATVTSRTPCPAVDLAGDKVLTKDLLSRAGIPVPPGLAVGSRKEALRAAALLGAPVVVKPVDGNQGRGVSLNLTLLVEVQKAYEVAAACGDPRRSSRVLVEKQVFGRHYRLLVVDGRLVAAAERQPARVTGDGVRSVRRLVEEVNQDPARGDGHQRALTRITLDAVSARVLARQGLDHDATPSAGQVVDLRDNANLSTGGTARDATDEVHPANGRLAVRVARLVGLDVAGVDVVAPDIGRPIAETGGVVLEVNAAPGLRMHLHPSQGRSRPVAGPILDSLFRPDSRELSTAWQRRGPWASQPGRIPIVAVTGTNGKTTVCRLIAHILAGSGVEVGLATTDGAWVGREKVAGGDCAGPQTAAAILIDPAIGAAVLETARGGIIRDGLAFDRCDVGLVTNISADHEGQDGMESQEDLAYVKALVVEAVSRDGQAVLNAADPFVHRMAGRARGEVVFFSRTSENLVARKHVLCGGRAVYPVGGDIVLEGGGRATGSGVATPLVALADVPLTLGGLLPFQVENALAAVAATWSLGVPPEAIRRGLRTFGLPARTAVAAGGYASNPGRFEVWRTSRRMVVLDYAHNRAAYAEALAAAGRLCRGHLFAVIGAPGDRLDDHLQEMGRLAARGADHLVIKEDADTRGRTRGEVASLLLRGVLDTGYSEARVEVVLDERAALERALSHARSGDWVMAFYEKREPLVDLLTALGATVVSPTRLSAAKAQVPAARSTTALSTRSIPQSLAGPPASAMMDPG